MASNPRQSLFAANLQTWVLMSLTRLRMVPQILRASHHLLYAWVVRYTWKAQVCRKSKVPAHCPSKWHFPWAGSLSYRFPRRSSVKEVGREWYQQSKTRRASVVIWRSKATARGQLGGLTSKSEIAKPLKFRADASGMARLQTNKHKSVIHCNLSFNMYCSRSNHQGVGITCFCRTSGDHTPAKLGRGLLLWYVQDILKHCSKMGNT